MTSKDVHSSLLKTRSEWSTLAINHALVQVRDWAMLKMRHCAYVASSLRTPHHQRQLDILHRYMDILGLGFVFRVL